MKQTDLTGPNHRIRIVFVSQAVSSYFHLSSSDYKLFFPVLMTHIEAALPLHASISPVGLHRMQENESRE